MIPKKIHYCWFGPGSKPPKALQCIDSWQKYAPDYELVEWNEDAFDVLLNAYTAFCYDIGKFAFLSDYVRLWAVYQQGGIYFDTDVELLKSPDFLLQDGCFIGFESKNYVNTGAGFGAEPGHPAVKAMLDQYDTVLPGQLISCPQLNTQALLPLGLKLTNELQRLSDVTVYPSEYFNPLNDNTGKLDVTPNTVSIHWYSKSWLSKKDILKSKITRPFHRLFGEQCFARKGKKNGK